MGTTIILTLFVLFPPINLHIRNMYGQIALRKLGWNGPLDNVLVQGKTAARIAIGGIGLSVVYKGGTIADDQVSDVINEKAVEQAHKGWLAHCARNEEANEVRVRNNIPKILMPEYSHSQIEKLKARRFFITYKEIADFSHMFRREFNAFLKLSKKGKSKPNSDTSDD